MAYEEYSIKKVFGNELVNIYCNKILDAVLQEFPGSESKLVAEGDLSRMIQGMATVELPVVPLVTNDANIYKYLVKNLQSILTVETQLSFKNRIQLVTSQAYFEIWNEAFAAPVNVDGIYCRDLGGSYPQPVSPYNIQLADPQVFSESVENELYFQGWSSSVRPPVKVAHVVGAASPAPISIDVEVDNVFLTQPAGKYSAFKFQTHITNWVSSNNTMNYGLVQLTGDVNVAYPGGDLLEANLLRNIITSFYILGYVEPGFFTWNLSIEIHGIRTDTGLTDRGISTLKIPFELDVLAEDEILSSTDHLRLAHVRETMPLEGQEIEVITAKDFSLTIPNYFEVTGGNLVEQAPVYGRRVYWGTGRQTVTVRATAALDQYEGSLFSGSFQLATRNDSGTGTRSSRGRKIYNVLLSAYIFEEHGFVVNPQSLDFFVIKGLQSAEAKDLDVISTLDFAVEHPFWLQVNPMAGGIFERLSVAPIGAENLIAGEYRGVITFTSAAAQTEVPVFLKVVESIDPGFSPDTLNFTDDNKEFTNLYSGNPSERASVLLNILRYDYSGFSEATDHSFKRAFFKYKADLHLGEIIARRFSKLKTLDEAGYKIQDLEGEVQLFKIYPYYRPASVRIDLQIENRGSGVISKEKNFEGVQYIKGRTPGQFQNDYGILNYSTVPVRVTPSSQCLFNFVRRFVQHEIKIFRNNALYKTITHSPGNDSLFGLAMIFKDFKPGDVIDVRLAKNGTDNFVQQYYVFPPAAHSNHIVFLNEYYMPESFEFTGSWAFSSQYSNITAKTFRELVERVENLETTKEQKLVINTGWILKSNQVIIDAIIRSRIAWFVKDGKEISLSAIGKDLVNEDSEKDLYQYDVEFIINRENDSEVYTS